MSSYERLSKMGYGLGAALLARRPSWSAARALARVVRRSPGSIARVAYVLILAVVISLLLKPERSHGQFRGIPAVPAFFPSFPFNSAFSASTIGFTGFVNSSFMTTPFHFPVFPIGPFYTMPGAPFQFPLFNLTDTSGFFNPFLAFFGGFGGFGAFGTPFGFSGFNSSFGFGNGLGFSGFSSSVGLNGFGQGGFGGMGGFAGKGFGGFNGKKAL